MPLKPYEKHICYCGAKLVTSTENPEEDPNLVLVGCANNGCDQGLAVVIRMQERTRLLHARDRNSWLGRRHSSSEPVEG